MTKHSTTHTNITYHIDENLREVFDNPAEVANHINHLQAQAAQEQDHFLQMQMYGELGIYCRILGQLDDAESYIYAAISLAHELLDKQARLVNLMQLAQIHQWRGDFPACDRILEQVIDACEAYRDASRPEQENPFNIYLDQAYHHLGLSKLDQGSYDLAADLFQAALDIREDKGDSDAIKASQYALAVTQARRISGK